MFLLDCPLNFNNYRQPSFLIRLGTFSRTTFLIIQFLYRLLNKKKLTCISNEYAEPIVFSDDIDILEIE